MWRSRRRHSRFFIDLVSLLSISFIFLLDVVHLHAIVLIQCCSHRFSIPCRYLCCGDVQVEAKRGGLLTVFLCHRWFFRIWGTTLLLNHPLSSFCWHSVSFTFGLKPCMFWNVVFLPLGILWIFTFYLFCSSYSFRSSCFSIISHFLYSCVQLLGSH
jgi:hypothetical protein